MSEDNKTVAYRCPVCFAREKDVVLHKDDKEKYYCAKCSFHGTKEEIVLSYSHLKLKYKNISKRITLEDICKI
ncbi:MAG: hypothetical protein RR444_06485 [Oscillospiraceae bacterium]